MSERAQVGFIGLGVMGGRMAATLARAGHPLAVHDVDPAKAGALAAAGAAACASPREVAQKSDDRLLEPAAAGHGAVGLPGARRRARGRAAGHGPRRHEHGGPGDEPRGQRGRRGARCPVPRRAGERRLPRGGDRHARHHRRRRPRDVRPGPGRAGRARARPFTTRGPPAPAASSSSSTTSCRWATCWSPPRPSCSA